MTIPTPTSLAGQRARGSGDELAATRPGILGAAELSWIATRAADGRPHVTPPDHRDARGHGPLLHRTRGAQGAQHRRQPGRRAHDRQQCAPRGHRHRPRGPRRPVTGEESIGALAEAWVAKYGEEWRFDVTPDAFRHPGRDGEHGSSPFPRRLPTVSARTLQPDPLRFTAWPTPWRTRMASYAVNPACRAAARSSRAPSTSSTATGRPPARRRRAERLPRHHNWDDYAAGTSASPRGHGRHQGPLRFGRRLPPRAPHRADRLRLPGDRVAAQGDRARGARPAPAPRQDLRLQMGRARQSRCTTATRTR